MASLSELTLPWPCFSNRSHRISEEEPSKSLVKVKGGCQLFPFQWATPRTPCSLLLRTTESQVFHSSSRYHRVACLLLFWLPWLFFLWKHTLHHHFRSKCPHRVCTSTLWFACSHCWIHRRFPGFGHHPNTHKLLFHLEWISHCQPSQDGSFEAHWLPFAFISSVAQLMSLGCWFLRSDLSKASLPINLWEQQLAQFSELTLTLVLTHGQFKF